MIIVRNKWFSDEDHSLRIRSNEIKFNGIPTKGRPLRFNESPTKKREVSIKSKQATASEEPSYDKYEE